MATASPSETSPKTVFITGAGRGIGREIALRLLAEGHVVYGSTNRSPCDLDLAASFTIDLGDEQSIEAGAGALAAKVDSLDLLINCAGVDARAFGGLEDHRGVFDFDATTFNAVMNVNVTGPMVLTTGLVPLLRASDAAMVVNVSSQLGSMQVAASKGRDAVYCVSKAALNMLSVKTAEALRSDEIGVVMLHPGWVPTGMGGPNGQLSIDDAARAICETISSLTFADTGRFIQWDGQDHPW